MTTKTKNLLLGLVLACVPLPIVLHAGTVVAPLSVVDTLYYYLVLVGMPATFLIVGYQQAQKTGMLDRARFLKASVVIGICIGVLVVIPLAVPLIYLRGDSVPAHYPLSQLVGILCTLTAWSLLCAFIFWGAAIRPLTKPAEPEAVPSQAI